ESCTEEIGRLTTGEDGETQEMELFAGTYYVKEITASKGFERDPAIYSVEVKDADVQVLISREVPKTGALFIEKCLDTDGLDPAAVELISHSSDYSVEGAEYTVYLDPECTEVYSSSILTIKASDETGMEGSSDILSGLPLGTYYIRETRPGRNLAADPATYSVEITEANCLTAQCPSQKSKDRPKMGSVKLIKVPQIPELTQGNHCYTLEGAVYGIYTQEDCREEHLFRTEQTGPDGSFLADDLPFGTYYIREITASTGYELDLTVYPVVVGDAAVQAVISREVPKTGSLFIKKCLDTDGLDPAAVELISHSSDYSVEGAEYTVYLDPECTKVYGSSLLTIAASDETGMEGSSNTISGVPLGNYYIKETRNGRNLMSDPGIYYVAITEENYLNAQCPEQTSEDQPKMGSAQLVKVPAIPELTLGNSCYSLEGAVYGIYTHEDCREEHLFRKERTDQDGYFLADELPFGTYFIREISPSEGYGPAACRADAQGTEVHAIILSELQDKAEITCEEPADAFPARVLLQKIDAQTQKPVPAAGGSFENAEYTVEFFTNYSCEGSPERIWILVTDENGKVLLHPDYLKPGSSGLYYDKSGQPVIPRGSFRIRETKPPEGYAADPQEYCFQVNGARLFESGEDTGVQLIGTVPAIDPDQGILSEEQIGRGNFGFKKTDGGREGIAGCLFEVTQVDTQEVHYIVTDPNGVFSSANFEKDNGNDAAVTVLENGEIAIDESLLSHRHNVWFSMDREGNQAEPIQEMASFPYGTYRFREIETSANQGLSMITFTGTVYESGFYTNDSIVYDLGTKDDSTQGQPYLQTTAWDGFDLDKLAETDRESVSLIDKVSFFNCRKGTDYTVKGKIWDKTNGCFYMEDGKELESTVHFTAGSDSGHIEMPFDLSAKQLEESGARALVIFEWLYQED
ncbi:MAG: VaFE repeat-containing surface-anchored protein, partial [Parasporobacterium sp.]|nr:VaFE repeat-containing surface-anchored protein [Parasporobacterium sp.]